MNFVDKKVYNLLFCLNYMWHHCIAFLIVSSINCSLFFLLCLLIALITVQVQEKKVKRFAVMNLDSSQSAGSSTTAIASTSSSKAPLPNGGCSDMLGCLNNDLTFPPGGYPSLRLPVVSYTRQLIYY